MLGAIQNYFSVSGRLNRQPFILILIAAAFVQLFILQPTVGSMALMDDTSRSVLSRFENNVEFNYPRSTLALRVKFQQQYFIWDYITWLMVFILVLPPMIRRVQDLGWHWAITLLCPAIIVIEAGWVVFHYHNILATEDPVSLLNFVPVILAFNSGLAAVFMLVLVLSKGDKGENKYGADPLPHKHLMETVTEELNQKYKNKGKNIDEVV